MGTVAVLCCVCMCVCMCTWCVGMFLYHGVEHLFFLIRKTFIFYSVVALISYFNNYVRERSSQG